MKKYKLRAECLYDVNLFRRTIQVRNQKIEEVEETYPDCVFTFESPEELPTLLKKIQSLDGDVHVMYETLELEENYTGERNRRMPR